MARLPTHQSDPPAPRAVAEGELLWTPPVEFVKRSQLARFGAWLDERRNLRFESYEALWRWSVSDPDAFWTAIWDYFEIVSATPYSAVRVGEMPRTRWFPGSRINFAEHVLRYEKRATPGEVAIVHSSEIRARQTLSWQELGNAVRTLATRLRALGVAPGDRVVGYLPNVPEAAIAMIATTAIGAIWASAAPEFGARTVLDRFAQIEPKVLFTVDGYRFCGQDLDRTAEVRAILAGLPSLETIVWLPYLRPEVAAPADLPTVSWADALGGPPVAADGFAFERVAEDHPLWILFTSGTTGLPKAIVHGHLGVTLEQSKSLGLTWNLGPGDRLFFYATPNWVLWNALVCGLLQGGSIVLFDGHPSYPDAGLLWKMAAAARVTHFGTSPTYALQMQKANIVPKDICDLGDIEMIFLSGAPAAPEAFRWLYDNVKADVSVASQYGCTDLCGGLVGSVATQPVYAGEIAGRVLGMDVHAWDDEGNEVFDQVGELVITSPAPTMPLYFWNDPGDERYHESYFSKYPGVWRQGDFIEINRRGGAYVRGRSDSTLNRFGVRIGSAEIYRCVEGLDEVVDSLSVCIRRPDGELAMLLFVKLAAGLVLNEALENAIRLRLRRDCSFWHVPDEVHQVPDIPYTLSAKKMEVPVRRILEGTPAEQVVARDAMRNPEALDAFVRLRAGGQRSAATAPVAKAWQRTLDSQSLRADVAFDAAGGDSLRLLKFVFHLEAELGRELPLEIFSEAGKPSDFAAAVDRFLVRGQRDDGAPLVFFLPGRGGDDPRQASFRAACGSALQIVPIAYPDWPEMARDEFDFGALVAHTVAHIERIAPTGPLRIAGYSLGGNLAYECSAALARTGRQVSALAVFDAGMGLQHRDGEGSSLWQRAKQTAGALRDPETRALALAQRIARVLTRRRARPLLRFLARFRNARLPYDFDFYLNAAIAERLTVAIFLPWYSRLEAPQRPLDVPLTVFRCQDRSDPAPDDLGWRAFCSDVNVVNVAGTHHSMFDREHSTLLRSQFLHTMNV